MCQLLWDAQYGSMVKMSMALPDLFKIIKTLDGADAKWGHNFESHFLFKGVVKHFFFQRLDCLCGVPCNMCWCLLFKKCHYFSYILPLFYTALSLLVKLVWWFPDSMKPVPQKYAMGSDWFAGQVCCDLLKFLYMALDS